LHEPQEANQFEREDQFRVEEKTVLLTFGLLSPKKRIEDVIEALPEILEQNPNAV
jgi:glycosyltransferase involved in cell wall biosynthesis